MYTYAEKFWKKSWDPGLADLDESVFEQSYLDLARKTFEAYPEKAALIYMGTEITFNQLERYANKFADWLIQAGVKKGETVGINLPNIPEYVIAWLGALKAGCVVSGVSPLLSADEMIYQLNDSDAAVLVTLDAIFEKRLVELADRLPGLRLIAAAEIAGFLPGIKGFLGKALGKIPTGKISELSGKTVVKVKDIIKSDRYSEGRPGVQVRPDDLCYLQYTGGTTGPAKGAMLTHRNIIADILIVQTWLDWRFGQGIALSGFPYFHLAGMFFNHNMIVLAWTQIMIPNPRDTDFICGAIKKYRPTFLANVPSLFQMLIGNPRFAQLDHSNVERCISAAAPFPEASQRELERIVGEGKIIEVYGMTETSPLTTMNPSKGSKKLGSIGLPIMNVDLKLVDPGTGEEVPLGQAGEICVRGPMVMKGYYKKPEETANCMDGDGFLHTGDVAAMDESGFMRIVDRTKDMIIVGGFKVFSKKVEEVLAGHPSVEMVALIGVPNPDRPGSEFVKAFISLMPGEAKREELKKDILDWASEKLAPYEVPKMIEFLDEMPLTSVGKLDKKVLRSG